MPATQSTTIKPAHKVGRPRRGTEVERRDAFFAAATKVFLQEGYGVASIDKVAAAAGVSTRTIYQHFDNKADLLAAVIGRLVERDMAMIFVQSELDALPVDQALTRIGLAMLERFEDEESRALFQLIAMEAHRFPELAEKVRAAAKHRVERVIEDYLRHQCELGVLELEDPAATGLLLLHMMVGEARECMLFCARDATYSADQAMHVKRVVDLFLNGCRSAKQRKKSTRTT
jgi:AcrR family transcriptional regulator